MNDYNHRISAHRKTFFYEMLNFPVHTTELQKKHATMAHNMHFGEMSVMSARDFIIKNK